MTEINVEKQTRLIQREFGRYLRRSGHNRKTVGAYLPKILRAWVALPVWREELSIDELLCDWIAIETHIVNTYRQKWQKEAQKTKARNKARAKKEAGKAKQLTLDL